MKAPVSITTVAAPLADGQVAAQYKVSVSRVDGGEVLARLIDSLDEPIIFDLAPGDYIATASRLDETGADIAAPVTGKFTLTAPVAQVPQSVTLQLTP